MARTPKIGGYNFSSLAVGGGILLAAGGVLPLGSSAFAEARGYGLVVLGGIVLLASIAPALGKTYGSRAALIGGGIALIALGALASWGRYDNLGYFDEQGLQPAIGYWLALAGGIFALVAGIGHIIVGLVDRPAESASPALATRRGAVPPPPPPGGPVWRPTHTVPMEGMPATPRPDPGAEILATLNPGLELQLLERLDDWAHVRTHDGWEAWVDGRKLVEIATAGV